MQGEFDFDSEPTKGKTRAELQDDLRKYGITPRPGYDPKGPNLPDNVPDPSTTREKYRDKAAENEEYKDKRTPKSDLIRQAELEKMKEILNTPKPKGVSGGSGSMGTGKMNRDITKAYKKGGTASSRADGCAQRGKTKGRMI